jgi:hypothetical protein
MSNTISKMIVAGAVAALSRSSGILGVCTTPVIRFLLKAHLIGPSMIVSPGQQGATEKGELP